jgi:hypothetical protein
MFALTLLMLLVPTLAHAAIYALSPSGSDSAPCSESQPCKSFSTALPLLRPGDTLVLQPGTYTQNLKIGSPPVTSGTASQPITVKGQPGVTIKPGGIEGATINGNTQYWVLEDLTWDCSGLSNAGSGANCVSVNWRPGPMEDPVATSHITLRRVAILHTANAPGTSSMGLQAYANDVVMEDVHVDGTSVTPGDGQGSHCVYIAGNRQIVRGGLFENCGGYGIQRNDSGNTWTQGNRDNQIVGTHVRNNGRRTSGGGGGVTTYHNQQGTRIVGNLIEQNRGPGILDEGSNNTGTLVLHNTIVSNEYNCYRGGSDASHPSTDTTFQNNICHQNANGVKIGSTGTGSAVVTNILSDKTEPQSTAGDTAAHGNLVGVDPQFVSSTDYHLQATSPGCGSGQPILGVTRDRLGRGTGRTPDMGRYACGGVTPPEPPQPPAGAVVCTGTVHSVPGAVSVVCTRQEEGR